MNALKAQHLTHMGQSLNCYFHTRFGVKLR
jgi:hypothetical protein